MEGRPLSNWTVSSGSRSLRFLKFPTQQVQWDRLRARYRQLSTYDKEAVRRLKEIDLIEMIGEVDRKSKQWATQILYFSAQWFEELERQLADQECRAPAMELASYFNNTSWASLARVRYNDDQLTDALTELGGDSDAARCKAAYLLLRHSLQVLSQRRPCFGLANDHADLGPLDTLSPSADCRDVHGSKTNGHSAGRDAESPGPARPMMESPSACQCSRSQATPARHWATGSSRSTIHRSDRCPQRRRFDRARDPHSRSGPKLDLNRTADTPFGRRRGHRL